MEICSKCTEPSSLRGITKDILLDAHGLSVKVVNEIRRTFSFV